jgi:RNA methyltransferase, TrmH family
VCVVEGPKVLSEALDAGSPVEGLYVVHGWNHPIIERARALHIPTYELAPGVLETIADTVTPQPLLAIVQAPAVGLDALASMIPTEGSVFVMVGVDLRDPGNVGTIIRSAEASGASAVVLCDGCVEAASPKTVRSSAGAVFHVPIAQGGHPAEVLARLESLNVTRLATAVSGDAVDYSADYVLGGRVAIVLGNEASGLSDELSAHIDGWITIPMAGRTESLNVGMAAAVLAFESARQRRATRG